MSESRSKSRSLIVPLLLASMVAACDRQSAPAGQGNAAQNAAPTTGEVPSFGDVRGKAATFTIDRSHKGEPLPDFTFTDAQGQKVTLARFAGRPILVNLWATWCGPCVAEMPQLDTLADTFGEDRLAVVTISQDTLPADKILSFFRAKNFKTIRPWMDPDNQFGFHYATGLLPTSVLYSADGREIGRITGALDWTGDKALDLIEEAVNGG